MNKKIAEALYNAGYRQIDENCVVITKAELKEYKRQAVKAFAEMLIEDFIKSADNQELSTVKGVLKNVCPAKVNKIKKRFEKEYEK